MRTPGRKSGFLFSVQKQGLHLLYSKDPEVLRLSRKSGLADDLRLKACKTHELMSWDVKPDETKMASSEFAVSPCKII